ncbi:hypothetical protein DYB37_011836 [Aphanomyces astaci]|uniref:START domain-containing protein n=1 Tax=Aphanomyces astaci TaxID=112090 RepID=A0A3R7ASE7_APHAT|nr:hypothetical protein DYB35_009680 [Aphanomyces astaci]RHZ30492.1 hypothetical protein DYB37_011836 [Aphanomyces astaci]
MAFADESAALIVAASNASSKFSWTPVNATNEEDEDGRRIGVFRGVVPTSDWHAMKATAIVRCPAWFLADKLASADDMTTFVIASRSLTSHASAPESKQYVGGINHPSGYVVDEMPDDLSCRVTMVAQLDLGGMLPALVINALAVDAPFKLL